MRLMAILALMASAVLCPIFSAQAEFKVRKIVEVVDSDTTPIIGGLRWSPDGAYIAYFRNGWLMLADTIGRARRMVKVQGLAGRFEWLDNTRLVVCLHSYTGDKTEVQRLCLLDVTLGSEQVLDSANRRVGQRAAEGTVLDGPKRSLEGNLYYGLGRGPSQVKRRITTSAVRVEAMTPTAKDHILRWSVNSDGLYKVALDGSDSTILLEGKQPGGSLEMDINTEGDQLAMGRVIRSLKGPEYIDMETSLPPPPEGSLCGIILPKFNPKYLEVAVHVTCDDGHMLTCGYAAIFDILSRQLAKLDELIGREHCGDTQFAPDGNRLAVNCVGRVYVVFREANHDQ